ncbi:MAG: PhoX family protein [Chloroflexota bacterium]|nr:PhoX family protein [Chloroflexota bacterium]
MRTINRRTFLKGAVATAVIGGPFMGFANRAWAVSAKPSFRSLRPVEDLRDAQVRLWLPDGFQYRSFHDTEDPVVLTDGTILPGRHDGMGAFAGSHGNVVLVRNHELNNPPAGQPPGTAFGPGTPYDARALGGTTTVVTSPSGEVVEAFTSLNGTMMNCSGGIMPWGSWITCEETINGPDVGPDFTGASNIPLERPHGFIFEVPAAGQSDRQPIRSAGRYAHEAVSFDPKEGILYLTEDNFAFPSGFYRYIPPSNPMETGRLEDGGRLQMLAIKGQPNLDLAAEQPQRATYKVEWVDIDDPAPIFPYTPGTTAQTANDQALVYVGDQGRSLGAAYFSRLEGSAYDDGVVYFCSTQGGGAAEVAEPGEPYPSDSASGYGNGTGQIWAYHTNSQTLQLVFQSPGAETLDFPDNVTTSRRGTLILCEDNVNDNFLRGLSRGGDLFDIALNRLVSRLTGQPRFNDEFAGSTFSPDGETLFVNIQASRGMTFAIWGPWEKVGV